jgi:hypothetical protein
MNDRCCADCRFALILRNADPGTLVCVTRPDAPGEPTRVAPCDGCPAFEPRPDPPQRAQPDEPPDEGAALIPLTRNKVAIVDLEDFAWLSRFKWYAAKAGDRFYACRREKGRTLLMHREIMQAPDGMIVDHKKDPSLNNRRRNLRVCTHAQNSYNRRRHDNKSGFKGVFPKGDKWYGVVGHKGKQHRTETLPDPVEAARARDRLAIKLFGEYAWLNFPDEIRVVAFSGVIRVHVRITATVEVRRSVEASMRLDCRCGQGPDNASTLTRHPLYGNGLVFSHVWR